MPEINLPTKATQDAIKQDTTDILSQFPINSGGIKSVQRGITPWDPAIKTVTISAVDPNKTFINVQAFGSTAGGSPSNTFVCSGHLLSATSLELRGGTNNTIRFYWEVIEFN